MKKADAIISWMLISSILALQLSFFPLPTINRTDTMEKLIIRWKGAVVPFNLTNKLSQCNQFQCKQPRFFQITIKSINADLAIYRNCWIGKLGYTYLVEKYWRICYGKTPVTNTPFTLRIPVSQYLVLTFGQADVVKIRITPIE